MVVAQDEGVKGPPDQRVCYKKMRRHSLRLTIDNRDSEAHTRSIA